MDSYWKGSIVFFCILLVIVAILLLQQPCSPSPITNFVYNYNAPAANITNFDIGITVTWDPVPGATSYDITPTSVPSTYPAPIVVRDLSNNMATSVYLYYSDFYQIDSNYVPIPQPITLTAHTKCGNSSSTITMLPCFLKGALVHMADGSTKAIEDVRVDDLVIGAFGEINSVLALHRPLLGKALMCKINGEHDTTNHHPHVSIDKKFYCGNPEQVSQSTYGKVHPVVDANGNVVERMLHGLKKERILKLEIGIDLKTVSGSKRTESLETYSMPEDTQLYNLVVGGSHTYHVDGYAVTGWPREDDFDYDRWTLL